MIEGSIWITGAGGLIGNYLVQTAPKTTPPLQLFPLARSGLELTNFPRVAEEFRRRPPGLIFHCAAMSRSPDCQTQPDLAREINVAATAHLSELAAQIPFVFFSTDLVFDGRTGNYDETAAVNPLSIYAETKVEAENLVLRNKRHLVVRTSLNCGTSPTGDRGFDEQLKRAWRAGQTLTLFTDEFRCPIPAELTARAVWELALHGQTGLVHVAGAERLSRWEIGCLFAKRWPDLKPQMKPASLKEYRGAPRAPDTSLNCAKAQQSLSFPLPKLSEWLGHEHSEP